MKKITCILIMISCLYSQSKRDPRAVALAGSYTTIANGIFSVGYNPGLIGLQQNRPLTIQGFQLDFGILGNLGAINDQCSFHFAPCSIHLKIKAFSLSERLSFDSGGGI